MIYSPDHTFLADRVIQPSEAFAIDWHGPARKVNRMSRHPRLPCYVIYDDGGYDLPLAKRSVGLGWNGILERLFEAKPDWIKVIQVKEKFGGLRYYIDDGSVRVDLISSEARGSLTVPADQGRFNEDQAALLDTFKKMIREAEAESFAICEECGAPGTLRPGRWIRTLCEQCHANRRSTLENE